MEEYKWVTITKGGKTFPIPIKKQTTNEYMNDYIRRSKKRKQGKKQDKQYQLTDEQLNDVIEESVAKGENNYAKHYITTMSPDEFLLMTASPYIWNTLEKDKFDLDLNQLNKAHNVASMIYLDIDLRTGKVTGHEGRHRAYALKNAGYKKMDVVVWPSNYDKSNAKEYKDFKIKAQDGTTAHETGIGNEAVLHKLTPVSTANINKIKNRDY